MAVIEERPVISFVPKKGDIGNHSRHPCLLYSHGYQHFFKQWVK